MQLIQLYKRLRPPFKYNLEAQIQLADKVWLQLRSEDYSSPTFPLVNYLGFVCDAMNEKMNRDSWGIKKWIHVVYSETDHGIICPQCRTEYSFSRQPTWGDYQCCPHCGQWLGEPEKAGAEDGTG